LSAKGLLTTTKESKMRDTYEFETTPTNENCQQLGKNYDQALAKLEAKTLVKQLERQFPEQPEGVYYRIRSNPHDFGSYYSVQFVYDDEDQNHCSFLNKLEENFPELWDEKAKIDLNLQGA
jgi:hypothetical protein